MVIVGARNLKNVSTLGKLDPFVRISYGKDVYQTTVLKDGGSPSEFARSDPNR